MPTTVRRPLMIVHAERLGGVGDDVLVLPVRRWRSTVYALH
jgi:hypothetical protein